MTYRSRQSPFCETFILFRQLSSLETLLSLSVTEKRWFSIFYKEDFWVKILAEGCGEAWEADVGFPVHLAHRVLHLSWLNLQKIKEMQHAYMLNFVEKFMLVTMRIARLRSWTEFWIYGLFKKHHRMWPSSKSWENVAGWCYSPHYQMKKLRLSELPNITSLISAEALMSVILILVHWILGNTKMPLEKKKYIGLPHPCQNFWIFLALAWKEWSESRYILK